MSQWSKPLLASGVGVAPVTAPVDTTKCAPCAELVTRRCEGQHSTFEVKCSSPVYFSCEKLCGQPLLCGNHTCEKPCHRIVLQPPKRAQDDDDSTQSSGQTELEPIAAVSARSGCNQCTQPCVRPRPGVVSPRLITYHRLILRCAFCSFKSVAIPALWAVMPARASGV